MSDQQVDIKFRILGLVLSYEVSKGHLKWKISDVSRKLGVSRSLIYYHFGNSKEDILDACYVIIAEEFYGLKHDFSKIFDFDSRILERSLLATRKLYLKNPAVVTFYHRWRLEAGPAQKRIIQMEKKYQSKLQAALPWKAPEEILAIHTIIHGVVTSPFTTPQTVAIVTELLKPMLLAGKTK